ncbi:hypothetical protein N4G70_33630 [Streptomyces sp. ASQP_92]|uniref:hypothetical protein n=1 Tax=Streptomyces sp. ASQP_92 TaxID=2979116 RepID=UPI0021BEA014|nr:hypothetical protein [Streptomyces sp. ASQP_92]MCT9093771.1 hypothetical protein [Streptomyces sp. ASQP_92]
MIGQGVKKSVAGAVVTVEALVPEGEEAADAAVREKLGLRYNTVRPFLSLLGESKALDAALAGRRILNGAPPAGALAPSGQGPAATAPQGRG